nr:carbamoyltransferase HypF [uncultured Cohaesibacter sp.]
MSAQHFIIRGQVQGVGFRPTVCRLARANDLTGDVRNTGQGVEIRLWGQKAAAFPDLLLANLPTLARIDCVEIRDLEGLAPSSFEIVSSTQGAMHAAVTPDMATCPECLAEIRDPADRRYRYPFNNCTCCGPRFSILREGPYDRARTTMQPFALCPDCAREFHDPDDRRFHAQPVACPRCGPSVWIEDLKSGARLDSGDPFSTLASLIGQGHLVAIRGLGGVHLACDATNASAVDALRTRKRRKSKAFALMARDLDVIRAHAHVSDAEEALLTGPAAPIVLLHRVQDAQHQALPEAVAPLLKTLGFMLPSTPLHHLLMEDLDQPLIMTSGNVSGHPQCVSNQEIRDRLAEIADFALMHNRDIANRLDDSVMRVDLGKPRMLRRARGFAPEALPLPKGLPTDHSILAMGADLKNTFCLVREGEAILSQHMGDLEDIATNDEQHRSLDLFTKLFHCQPDMIAVDSHPDHHATRHGRAIANGAMVVETQHHHAHIASCLAENGVDLSDGPVLGIALDGTGLGSDGTIWGGEFLLADYTKASRLAHFKAVPLPGGEAAVREPWRNAFAQIHRALGWRSFAHQFSGSDIVDRFEQEPLAVLQAMMERNVNAPLSSSCGRLFDAAAALSGIAWGKQSYEGEAAICFEAAIDQPSLMEQAHFAYSFGVEAGDGLILDPAPALLALFQDRMNGVAPGLLSARFHLGLSKGIADMAADLSQRHALDTVALSGGCFQNATLLALITQNLTASGLRVLSHSRVPCNDGGLSLGQAMIALARTIKGV